jgi:hypothetical protein
MSLSKQKFVGWRENRQTSAATCSVHFQTLTAVYFARMVSANTEALVLQSTCELNMSAWISPEGVTKICTTNYFILPFFWT